MSLTAEQVASSALLLGKYVFLRKSHLTRFLLFTSSLYWPKYPVLKISHTQKYQYIMPLAITNRFVTCLLSVVTVTAINGTRGWHSQFLARAGDTGELVSRPTTGSQRG